nr:hypothetical protein [uncultured Ralstonia sp.]
MSDAKHDARRQIHAEKVTVSRALRMSVPAEARPAPVNRKDWLRQRKEQLQAARAAAKQRRDQLKAEILSAAQEVAREERVAARQEAERVKAEAKASSVHAKEDARAAAKFERSKPARPASKRKTLGTGKRKLVSYADLLRMRG